VLSRELRATITKISPEVVSKVVGAEAGPAAGE